MMFAGERAPLLRIRLLDALSMPAPLVVLVGPIGAGASTVLRQWAARQHRVAWAVPGALPVPSADGLDECTLIIDDANALSAADWERLAALRAAHPQLSVRLAVRDATAVPAQLHPEIVGGLCFTASETAAYLAGVHSGLNPAAVHRITDGSPAAVRAIAQLTVLDPAVVDGILAALPPGPLEPERAVLAVPEVLTRELAEELGAPPEFIDDCERSGLGEWTAGAGHPLFVLTAPVRAATRLMHPVESPAPVRQQVAAVLLRQGAWYGALREGAATRSLEVIDAALRGGGLPLIGMHGAAIPEALRGVRTFELRRWPIIAMALALIHNARHEHRVRTAELLGVALIAARRAPARSGERALLRVIESAIRRLLGIGDGGVKAAQAAARILEEISDDDRQSVEGLLGDLHIHAGISLMYGHCDGQALTQFEQALAVSTRPNTHLISYGGIALIHARSGDLIAGRAWIDTALRRPWSDDVLHEYQGSMLLMAQAWSLIEQGRLDDAEEAIAGVWHIIDTIEHWPTLAHLRAMIDIGRGDAEAGLERVRSLRRQRGGRIPRSQERLLDLTESSLNLAAGDVAAARGLSAHPGDQPAVVLAVVRAELFASHPERALRMLGTIRSVTPADRAAAAALEAVVLKRLGRAPDAPANRARAIAQAQSLTTPFLLLPSEGLELFADLVPWRLDGIPVRSDVPQLTARESVILEELVETANAGQIAARLHVSENTVKSQRRSLYRKLGAASRDQALAAALEFGLLGSADRG